VRGQVSPANALPRAPQIISFCLQIARLNRYQPKAPLSKLIYGILFIFSISEIPSLDPACTREGQNSLNGKDPPPSASFIVILTPLLLFLAAFNQNYIVYG
jgi:hypothetical protein